MKSNFLIICLVLATSLCIPAAAEIDCDSPPNPWIWKSCCEAIPFFNDDVTDMCQEYDEPKMTPRPHQFHHRSGHPHHSPCFISCVFNETGILDDERQLDESKLFDYLTDTFTDENTEWIPVLQESFKNCMITREEMHEHFSNDLNSKRIASMPPCMADAGLLMGCVFIESFQNCPSSSWNNTDECSNLRKYMINCGPPFRKWKGRREGHSKSVENDLN